MEGFKPFGPNEPEKKKFIIPENAIESGPEIKFEKGLGRKKDYYFEEIKELEVPVENLVKQLKEDIDSCKYDTLIGDDASGRIPTLILRKIIEARIHKLHPDLTPEENRDALKTYFVNGAAAMIHKVDGFTYLREGKEEMDQANKNLLKYFESEKYNFKKRILLITEYINRGSAIGGFTEIFNKLGIPFDIVTIARLDGRAQEAPYEAGISENGGRLFMGSYCADAPKIYGQSMLSGVLKKAFKYSNMTIGDIHTQPYVKFLKKQQEEGVRGLEDPKIVSRDIEMTRQDINLLVEKILEKVWGEKK